MKDMECKDAKIQERMMSYCYMEHKALARIPERSDRSFSTLQTFGVNELRSQYNCLVLQFELTIIFAS